jgi:hypothetical protein
MIVCIAKLEHAEAEADKEGRVQIEARQSSAQRVRLDQVKPSATS